MLHLLTNRLAVHFKESESILCLVRVKYFAVYTSAFLKFINFRDINNSQLVKEFNN